ncbi:MAG: FKBP-type peptidyl-prolyl cis-trans isomerase [Paludibacteraceae bacterium]|nr:FKBP-type peptidyl-prolyl cis-trans isomerase [Paludibacteraceae bacterium]MBQ3998623.1 FKBP-type peptidyl-prolyl cis-trans isomerase [Paludibacteraceae bacterium]
MDSKVKVKGERLKVKGIAILAIILVCFAGCKENKWADWKVQNEVWLQNNAQQDGVVVTSSGLQYKVIADPGKDFGEPYPNTTSTILCDYTVELINGYVVESNNNVSISLSSTIPGFAEGCHKVHVHGDVELYIPAYLGYDYSKHESGEYNAAEGYGTEGTTGYIPPYSTLIYKVHICGISN